MGRPSKLTPTITRAILDVLAAGGTRAVAAEAAGISESTLYKWLRRGAEDATTILQEVPDPDQYTIRDLRAQARAAAVPGFSRMNKAELVAAIAAQPSPYMQFVRCIKKAEAEAEAEWLAGVARIARGAAVTTTVTEELDGAGAVKSRTIRTVTGQATWQAYAWLLERRHPERWARTERPASSIDSGTFDPEEVIARGEAQMRIIDGLQEE